MSDVERRYVVLQPFRYDGGHGEPNTDMTGGETGFL